ncbi:MAG: flagellar hook-associated protein 2 [Vulcanibacillus sp.]
MTDMRIGGLASGMDTEKIVSDLIRAQSIPLDIMQQNKQLIEWKRDDYREMNSLLTELDRFIFDGIGKQSTFGKKIVNSSNASAVSAVNINSISELNATIRVDQTAEAAYMNSNASIRVDSSFDPSGKLVDQRINLNNDFTSNTFTIQAIQSDGTLGEEVSFTIDPDNDSLDSIINQINNSTAGVSAFYDEFTGKISLIASSTGDVAGDAEVKISGDFLTSSLGLASDNILAQAAGDGSEGLNAKFNLNGLDTERTSNVFRINGYEYSLHEVTDDGDQITQAGESVTLSSSTNTDEIYNSIVDFVNKYNEIIETINGKISEERFQSFAPLTEEQKAEMSDREIELWEDKAQSGMLRNDSLLRSAVGNLRMDLYSPVTGINDNYNQLAELGIKTSSNYSDKGKLLITEGTLKEAISQDPMAIYQLFNQEVKDVSGNLVYEESGLVNRMRQTIGNSIDNIEARAGNSITTATQYTLGLELNNLDDKIERFQDYLNRLEDRYWSQYSFMEEMLAASNSQFDMLTSFLNSSNNQQ